MLFCVNSSKNSDMPINKMALLRYKTIDACLQNRFRKWTLEDLVEACSDALYEFEGITKGVSLRTVQLDLQTMRSEKLGYNAPIIVTDKKFYTYEDKNYSITNIPLSQHDLGTLNEVVNVLKQFKGFGYFTEMQEMIAKLENKVISQKNKGVSYLDLEKNELLIGLNHIDPLLKAVQKKMVVEITYQSFKARQPSQFIVYPYLLKEFRNRWFVLCMRKDKPDELILALDRVKEIRELPQERFKDAPFHVHRYFENVIGVTKRLNQPTETVKFRVEAKHAPYIVTKPLHASQKVLAADHNGTIFSINVVLNMELEKELLAFGETLEVLSPKYLRSMIRRRITKAARLYNKKQDTD
ncbi:MAG: WYL domain-containing protein [Fluviicola sp.]|nr:WYL domain-containing protein [Fluviicola sp.]